ncbi:MAG: hypothetical protein AAF719_07325 [Pseudomonadota bacterium]
MTITALGALHEQASAEFGQSRSHHWRCGFYRFLPVEEVIEAGAEIPCVDNFFNGPRMHPNDGRFVSNFVVQTLPENDPKQRRSDICLAKSRRDWAPSAELRDGLKNTIGYFDKLLSERTVSP